nr:threonine/serine dehydratase [Fredinandcohnia onubensis]
MLGQNLNIPTLETINQARERIQEKINLQTKIVNHEILNMKYGFPIYIKTEALQPTGSFKIRGAFNKILALQENQSNQHYITASAGNHAIGVAYSSQYIGVQATVVVPEKTPQIKIDTCKRLGAKVVVLGETYDEAYTEARRLSEEHQYVYIHPVADCDVIAGQGTIGLEILNELPEVEQVIVPIGGGGLISGIAIAIKSIKPDVKVIGVQPEGSNAYYESWKTGKLTKILDSTTIADGLSLKNPEPYMFNLMQKWVDEIICVKEDTIKAAINDFLFLGKVLVEGSGAVTLASIMENQIEKQKRTVVIASGSNIDKYRLLSIIHGDE